MDLLLSKIVALFGQVFVLLLFVLLPMKVNAILGQNGERGKLFLSCLQCFGGGALLGCFMLIQTPEIRHLLRRTLMDPNDIVYPIPEIIAGGGFFFFLFVERLVVYCDKRWTPKGSLPQTESKVSMLKSNSTVSNDTSMEIALSDKIECPNGHVVVVVEKPVIPPEESTSSGSARSILMLIILSADGLFQGLAIGLKYSVPAVWNLFVAVVGHEFVVAFCLGLELVKHQKRCVVVISGLLYACTPALGTGVGILIFQASNNADDDRIDMVNGILQSVATGVFLYVAFIGILVEELTVNARFVKLIAVLAGFGLMAGLAILNGPTDNIHPSIASNGHVPLFNTTSAPEN